MYADSRIVSGFWDSSAPLYFAEAKYGGMLIRNPTINAIKIYDLAAALCKVFKMPQSKIKLIGLRQGEKIHEKIITENEFCKLKVNNHIYLIDYLNIEFGIFLLSLMAMHLSHF